ncbi:MAG: transposase [Thermodesulfobacteriota bacterium]
MSFETLAEVYKHEKIARQKRMSDDSGLLYHQAESCPLMEELHVWLQTQFDEKKVEPNSSLGQAIKYMLKRWHKLTRFLQVPGAPLDNNICERALQNHAPLVQASPRDWLPWNYADSLPAHPSNSPS